MDSRFRSMTVLVVLIILVSLGIHFYELTYTMSSGKQAYKVSVLNKVNNEFDVYYTNDVTLNRQGTIYEFVDAFGRRHMVPVYNAEVTKIK